MVTVEHAALHLLDMWFLFESRFRMDLRSDSREKRRLALDQAARYFGIARNFDTAYDIRLGLPRYQPVIDLLAGTEVPRIADPIALVTSFASDLAACYGNKSKISAASKILWLYHLDPIRIYDSQAVRALRARPGDYSDFVHRWEARWSEIASDVMRVCDSLPEVFRYAQCGAKVQRAEVGRVALEPWFQHRVLDVVLWYEGMAYTK